MGSCAAPSAKGDDKFITTDYLQQCQTSRRYVSRIRNGYRLKKGSFFLNLSGLFFRAGLSCRTSCS
ncbi:hypothetical protein [Escherichia coli]|uniref:hypothetical protein n=1 Tax=Escherichia coli TaxID=562 RepID=UPI000FD1726C|nr:hypothetical protein [Escherichia coli]AZU74089.1 hypothetical protein EM855_23165 [Escherichia coli]AZU78573.1 hypothetical protein ELE40_23165 [Escherichia coli]